MRSAKAGVAALAVLVLTLGACSGGTDEPAGVEPTTSGAEPTTTAPPTESSTEADDQTPAATSSGPRFPECEPGEGKTVTLLGEDVVQEQVIPGVAQADFLLDGETVEGAAVEESVIPERVADLGCMIEYEAPGGCLPAMEISGAYIPAYAIPERVLAELTLPDGTVLEEIVLPAQSVDEVVIDGVSVDEVCQLEADPGEYVSSVWRNPIYRDPGYQDPIYQDPVYRDPVSVDGGSVPGVGVSGVGAPGLGISGHGVPGVGLAGYYLEGTDDVEVSTKDDEVYYLSEGDVLFGNDEDVIQPDAEAALVAVVADIAGRGEPTKIRVEGHTDDVGTEEHNLDLSQRRADAVAAWLAGDGGLDPSLISTAGLGFEFPRADNATDEGRAQNRRVVITVAYGS